MPTAIGCLQAGVKVSPYSHIVQIRGPARMLKQSGMLGWLIKPLHKRVWGVTELDGATSKNGCSGVAGCFMKTLG